MTTQQYQPNNLRGAVWGLLATGMFALAAIVAKVAVTEYHVLQILLFRQIVVFMSCLPRLYWAFPESLQTQRPLSHALRLVGAFVALSCSIWAISLLPITLAVTLSFAQVFFIAIISTLVLKESLGISRLFAVLAGFAGVVVAMQPVSVVGFSFHVFIPVVGALGASVAVVAVRVLSQTESTETLLLYQSVFVGVLAAIPMFWFWKTPSFEWLLVLLFIGVLSTGGQWAGVNALRMGEATVIGCIKYLEIVFAAVLGFFLFTEVPAGTTLIGAAIIVGAAVFLLYAEAKRSQTDSEKTN